MSPYLECRAQRGEYIVQADPDHGSGRHGKQIQPH